MNRHYKTTTGYAAHAIVKPLMATTEPQMTVHYWGQRVVYCLGVPKGSKLLFMSDYITASKDHTKVKPFLIVKVEQPPLWITSKYAYFALPKHICKTCETPIKYNGVEWEHIEGMWSWGHFPFHDCEPKDDK